MTDEEMAKEYAVGRTYPKFETDYIANFVLREVEGTFLAGLKAGRQKFHKIAVEGLPSDSSGQTYVVVDVYNCYALASFDNGVWHNYHNIEDVIAWCEIPKFEEE